MFWRYKTIATDPATSLLQSPIFVVSQCWNSGRWSCRTPRDSHLSRMTANVPSFNFWSRACRHHRVLVGVPRGSSQFLLVVPCHSLFALGLALGSPGVAQAHAVKHPKRTNMQVYHEHPSTLSVPLTLLLLVLSQICHRLPPHTLNKLSPIAGLLARTRFPSLSCLRWTDNLHTHTHIHTHTDHTQASKQAFTNLQCWHACLSNSVQPVSRAQLQQLVRAKQQ